MSEGAAGGGGRKAHLRIDRLRQTRAFKGQGVNIKDKFKRENRAEFGQRLLDQIVMAFGQADVEKTLLGVTEQLGKTGAYLSFIIVCRQAGRFRHIIVVKSAAVIHPAFR